MNSKTAIAKLLIPVLLLSLMLSACGGSNMPFNGEVSFHGIALTIPEDYIRDSTESTKDLWVFEKGFYSRYIILSRKDGNGDAAAVDSYAAYLTEQGVQVQQGRFLDQKALLSGWYEGEMFCQELFFIWDGSFYAISLRGGTEADFDELIQSVRLLSAQGGE